MKLPTNHTNHTNVNQKGSIVRLEGPNRRFVCIREICGQTPEIHGP